MRTLLLALLRRALAWPQLLLAPAGAGRLPAPLDRASSTAAVAAARRAWGEIRARYRLKGLPGAGMRDIFAQRALRVASDDDIRDEFIRRGLSLSTDDRRAEAACIIGREELDEVRSLLGRHRRTEALLVIERALPRDFSGAFAPVSPTAYHP